MDNRRKAIVAVLGLIIAGAVAWTTYSLVSGTPAAPKVERTPARRFIAAAVAVLQSDPRFADAELLVGNDDDRTVLVSGQLPNAAARAALERALGGVEGADTITFQWQVRYMR